MQISRLRDFTRCYEKTSFRILRRGPGPVKWPWRWVNELHRSIIEWLYNHKNRIQQNRVIIEGIQYKWKDQGWIPLDCCSVWFHMTFYAAQKMKTPLSVRKQVHNFHLYDFYAVFVCIYFSRITSLYYCLLRQYFVQPPDLWIVDSAWRMLYMRLGYCVMCQF